MSPVHKKTRDGIKNVWNVLLEYQRMFYAQKKIIILIVVDELIWHGNHPMVNLDNHHRMLFLQIPEDVIEDFLFPQQIEYLNIFLLVCFISHSMNTYKQLKQEPKQQIQTNNYRKDS